MDFGVKHGLGVLGMMAGMLSQLQAQEPVVMGWVPPYGIEQSETALAAAPELSKALTRIGLQFWNPSRDGKGVVFAPVDSSGRLVDSASVVRLRNWARERGIKVLLTVYNNSQILGKWDWELARRAFAQNQSAFVAALVAETLKYELDGVDLDLEGEGSLDKDRKAFAEFVAALSVELRKHQKLLTVDTFHSPCYNAPNMSWWGDWLGQVDQIHTMGYMDLGEGSQETFRAPWSLRRCASGAYLFRYSWQLKYGMDLGYRKDQIVMGVPTWVDAWSQSTVAEQNHVGQHLRDLKDLGVGIALWDLQLGAPAWRSDSVGQRMQDLGQKVP
jgi:hypothetical protein